MSGLLDFGYLILLRCCNMVCYFFDFGILLSFMDLGVLLAVYLLAGFGL